MHIGERRLSITRFAGGVGACQLCAKAPVERTTVVVVQDVGGDAALFLSCDGCGRAARRLAAVAGGAAAQPEAPVPARRRERRREPRRARPELIHRCAEHVVGADGTRYVARARGVPRRDGTWVGWLEFAAPGTERVLRTRRETTQPNRACLAYWATGLEAVYLDGAFARARPPGAPGANGSRRGGG